MVDLSRCNNTKKLAPTTRVTPLKTLFFPSCAAQTSRTRSRDVSLSTSCSTGRIPSTTSASPGSRKSSSFSWTSLSFVSFSSLTQQPSSLADIRSSACLSLANLAITADCCATLCDGGLLEAVCDDALRSAAGDTPADRAALSVSVKSLIVAALT